MGRIVFALSLVAGSAWAQDHDKILTPYPGAKLVRKSGSEFERYEVVLGPAKDDKYSKVEVKEGRVTRFHYESPEGRSPFEIFTNYKNALKKGGFEILFSCVERECGNSYGVANAEKGIGWMPESGSHYLAARAKNTWVSLHVTPRSGYVHFVTEKAMEDDLVKVDAAALAKGIEDEGHIAVYGILFDTGKDEVKPESAPVIAEIMTLLKNRPGLKLHVVGHTDNVGNFEQNLALAKRRAASVVKALTKQGVAANRLRPDGVGSLSPVASNKSDAGRAKNRRVDLVQQ